MAVEHEASSVKTLHGTNIAGPSIDRLFAVRRECCRGGHGKSEQTVLAVVDKPVLGTVIAIGIPPASGVPIEMYQRIVQRLVGHLRTAFFGQQQKGEHVRTSSVEVAVAVTGRDPAPPQPAAEVLRGHSIVHARLNVGENHRVSCAQIGFSQRNTAIADVPRITMRLHVPRPFAGHGQILRLAGGKQEQHADTGQSLLGVRLRKIVGHLPHDLVGFWAVKRPRLTVRSKHGHLHRNGRGHTSDGEFQQAISSFRLSEQLAELNARIDIGQLTAIDAINDLSLG